MQLGFSLGVNALQGGGFSPAVLFAASEPGVWYDPSDLTTLFQDSVGTTPVTAAAQPVGLMLDKSQGLTLGAELVTNGGFATDTSGWTLSGGTATVTSGQVQITGATTRYLSQSVATVVGRGYRFGGTIVTAGATFNAIRKSDNATAGSNVVTLISTAGTAEGFFIATATTTHIVLQVNDAGTATFDNISVRELPGNHAAQSSAASRPTYGVVPVTGRRNLLTYTEQFNVTGLTGWSGSGVSITADTTVAPDGTTSAETLTATVAANNSLFQNTGIALAAGPASSSVYVKAGTAAWVVLCVWQGSGTFGINQWFNLQTGALGARQATAGYTETGGTVTDVGNGWYRITVSGTVPAAAHYFNLKIVDGDAAFVYTNILGDTVFVWGAQLEAAASATDYQKVVTAFDVTEAGVASLGYLSFDGTDDFMITPTITPGTDKAQVFAGVRKLSDAAAFQTVLEHSASINANNGSLAIFAPGTGGTAGYEIRTKGTSEVATLVNSGYAAPLSNALTYLTDMATPIIRLRLNGVQAAGSGGSPGTGNYLAYPMYIGRRGGTSLAFGGQIYGLVARFGANLTADQIDATEAFIAGKTGVTL